MLWIQLINFAVTESSFVPPFVIGENVEFIGCPKEQIHWGNNDDPNGFLIVGKTYKVTKVDIHSQHTKISVEGVVGRFNSVCFASL